MAVNKWGKWGFKPSISCVFDTIFRKHILERIYVMLNLFGVAMDFPIIQSQSTTLQRWHPWQEYPHTCWGYDHQKMNYWDRTTGHRDTNINQWHHTASSECSKLLYIWFSLMAKPFSFTGIGQETKKPEWPRQTHPRIWGTYFSVCTSWYTSLTS